MIKLSLLRVFSISASSTLFIILLFTTVLFSQSKKVIPQAQIVPLGGNTWQISGKRSPAEMISNAGIVNWKNGETEFNTFFRVTNTGTLKLWVNVEVPKGKSTIEVSVGDQSKTLQLSKSAFEDKYVGEFIVKDTGYVAVQIKGIKKEGDVFANISSFKIAGSSVNENTRYVKNNEDNFFYWGRRGPSVHLGYQVPKEIEAKWYYNEVTVPEGDDVIGSYYMANGFTGGYFGIQVNSEKERRVLFSVWSPYVTDNPKDIPEEEQIKMLKKGKDVHVGEFGNEGSGGQSFLRYNWQAGVTYKFLLKGEPIGDNRTVYTAWFYAPEVGDWQLIASFNRPKTDSWLTGFHSFLENFSPNQGIYERKVLFSNQWVADKNDTWIEVSRARFTADNTARTGFRMDYSGGIKNGSFFLRNCGFFSDYTPIDMFFERPETNKKPNIEFDKLPY